MVDVIIPAYNADKTIGKALSSLVAQVDGGFSVIIVDDFSVNPVNVEKYANELAIKVIRNEKNMGCGKSREIGVEASEADYVFFLDADDILMPYTVKVFNDAVKKKSEADIISSQFYIKKGEKLRLSYDLTHCHGKLYRREFLKNEIVISNAKIKYADDSFLNAQCFELAKATYTLSFPTYIWVRNEESVTAKQDYKATYLSDFIKGIRMSTELILNRLPTHKINHMKTTMNYIETKLKEENFDTKEKQKIKSEYKKLKGLLRG